MEGFTHSYTPCANSYELTLMSHRFPFLFAFNLQLEWTPHVVRDILHLVVLHISFVSYIERDIHTVLIYLWRLKKTFWLNYYITFYYVILYQLKSQVSLYTNKHKICRVIFNLIENQYNTCMKTEESQTLFLTSTSKPVLPHEK